MAAGVTAKEEDDNMIDANGLLKPIQNKKIRKKISNEIKVLFSNRTFIYNLIENPQNDENKKLLEIAKYLYTNLKQKPVAIYSIESIDLTNPIIAKSFGTSLDEQELDDVLIIDEFTNSKWYKNTNKVKVKVQVDETVKSYTHYKRIYNVDDIAI